MIKLPQTKKLDDHLQGQFFGKKEVRLLPPSLLKALTNKQEKNYFVKTTKKAKFNNELEFEILSDYMSKEFM